MEKGKIDQVSNNRIGPIANTCDLETRRLFNISSARRVDEYSRLPVRMELNLAPGESRGYWKYHTPGKWFKQAKAVGKINNERATMLFDSGAEVSIIDATFARRVGCTIDDSQRQECVGIGENTYMTEGRTKIKITLNGSLVYYFDVWVGDQVGQEAILGMDFMVPAGIRLDLADGTLCLPDEVKIHLAGRRPPYGTNMQPITAPDQYVVIPVGGSTEMRIGAGFPKSKLWVRRDKRWVPTVTTGLGQIKYLILTNIVDQPVVLDCDTPLGWWMIMDMIPRSQGYVSVGSRRYNEWQTLAFEATTELSQENPVKYLGPLVDHPLYPAPTKILTHKEDHSENNVQRSLKTPAAVKIMAKVGDGDRTRDGRDEAIEQAQAIPVEDDSSDEGEKGSESSGREGRECYSTKM